MQSRDGWFSTDAQAACVQLSASKRAPFFQTIKVMAAILRASVRRAISGLIPLAPELRRILEGLLDSSGPKGRALKEIFQIVVMVLLSPPHSETIQTRVGAESSHPGASGGVLGPRAWTALTRSGWPFSGWSGHSPQTGDSMSQAGFTPLPERGVGPAA